MFFGSLVRDKVEPFADRNGASVFPEDCRSIIGFIQYDNLAPLTGHANQPLRELRSGDYHTPGDAALSTSFLDFSPPRLRAGRPSREPCLSVHQDGDSISK